MSFIFKTGGQAISFLVKHTGLMILALVTFLMHPNKQTWVISWGAGQAGEEEVGIMSSFFFLLFTQFHFFLVNGIR